MTQKSCFRCGVLKPLCDFYAHPQMADGHLNKCKECTKSDTVANRTKRLEYYREYDRKRFGTEARRAHRRCARKRGVARHPDRFKARSAVARAVRSGKLVRKACEVCGAARTHAHHDDYSKPLEVRWLCVTHHLMVHGRYIVQTA